MRFPPVCAVLFATCAGLWVSACDSYPHLTLATPTPFAVTTVSPTNDASDVSRRGPITATFSRPVDAATVDASSFRLLSGTSSIPSLVSSSGNTITLVPLEALPHLRTLDAIVAASLMSEDGQSLGTPYEWSFETTDLTWTSSGSIGSSCSTPSTNFKIASLSNATTLLACILQPTSTFAIIRRTSTGWLAPIDVESDTALTLEPSLAANTTGTALAVWSQSNGTTYDIRGSISIDGGLTWGPPQIIDGLTGTASASNVAINDSNVAFAVWKQFDGTRDSIFAARRDPATGWEAPQLLEANSSGNADRPRVALDDAGNAFAVWEEYDGTRWNIAASRFVTSWSGPQFLDATTSDARNPLVVATRDGRALAVWNQGSTDSSLFSSTFVTSWGAPQAVEALAGNSFASSLSPAGGGDLAVGWHQDSSEIWWNTFSFTSGWSAASRVAVAQNPVARFAFDDDGNGLVVWQQRTSPPYEIASSRYTVAQGWTPAILLASSGAAPTVAVTRDGFGTAVWPQDFGMFAAATFD